MRINETGDDCHARGVDHLGALRCQLANFVFAADRQDAAALDGQGLGYRLLVVDGVDRAGEDH